MSNFNAKRLKLAVEGFLGAEKNSPLARMYALHVKDLTEFEDLSDEAKDVATEFAKNVWMWYRKFVETFGEKELSKSSLRSEIDTLKDGYKDAKEKISEVFGADEEIDSALRGYVCWKCNDENGGENNVRLFKEYSVRMKYVIKGATAFSEVLERRYGTTALVLPRSKIYVEE